MKYRIRVLLVLGILSLMVIACSTKSKSHSDVDNTSVKRPSSVVDITDTPDNGNDSAIKDGEEAEASDNKGNQTINQITDQTEYTVQGSGGTLTIKASDAWKVEVLETGDKNLQVCDYGFHISPAEAQDAWFEVGYAEQFGVCGTGLTQEEKEIAGVKANIGTYDNNESWEFIFFENNIVVIRGAASDSKWFTERNDEIMELLETIKLL